MVCERHDPRSAAANQSPGGALSPRADPAPVSEGYDEEPMPDRLPSPLFAPILRPGNPAFRLVLTRAPSPKRRSAPSSAVLPARLSAASRKPPSRVHADVMTRRRTSCDDDGEVVVGRPFHRAGHLLPGAARGWCDGIPRHGRRRRHAVRRAPDASERSDRRAIALLVVGPGGLGRPSLWDRHAGRARRPACMARRRV